jgi:hypothetical protein
LQLKRSCVRSYAGGKVVETLTHVNQIVALAQRTERYGTPGRFGCLILRPAIPLKYKETGATVHADSVDVNGKYPNTVHTRELGCWYDVDQFELVPAET